jgi:Spy/CpxP family protein refolding chaperone
MEQRRREMREDSREQRAEYREQIGRDSER